MYNVQRIFNLVWIIICANIVEMTLNYNNMLDTLGTHGHINSPAQLLPLLVGSLSFLRTLWLIFQEHGKTVMDILRAEAEMAEKEAPKFLRSIPRVFDITVRRIISPLSVSSDTASAVHHERSHSHTPHHFRPLHHRYIVAWMPWLSVFKFWKHYCPVEESLPTTQMDATHKETTKADVVVHEDSVSS
jgi:hypothetical protein